MPEPEPPTALTWIDSHCHPAFALREPGAWEDLRARSRAAGVREMIAIGTGPDDWVLYRDLARHDPGTVHWTLGLHPADVDTAWEEKLDRLESLLAQPPDPAPRAIGEIGLDVFRVAKPDRAEVLARQRQAFRRQLDLARHAGLPVVIHSRETLRACLEVLTEADFPPDQALFHCFADGPEEMEQLRAYGARASFTGLVTFANAPRVQEALQLLGVEELLLETDSPYLSPEPYRGRTNGPARIPIIGECCARLLRCPVTTVAARSTANTRAFFGLPDPAPGEGSGPPAEPRDPA
jgi:TatD DNase family protein